MVLVSDDRLRLCLLLINILLIIVDDQDFATSIFFYELLHRHLNEHVVVNLVGTPSFEFASYSSVNVRLLGAEVCVGLRFLV